MSMHVSDQAEGLRRLLAPEQSRCIAVVSGKPRVGQTNLVINLGLALANLGKSVLILDEGIGADACAARLGLETAGELAQGLERPDLLARIPRRYGDNLMVLPAREGLRRYVRASAAAQRRVRAALAALLPPPDVVLLDLAADRGAPTLAAGVAADEILVAVSPERLAITRAYALIKQLAQQTGRHRIHLAAVRVRDTEHATMLCDNIARATTQYAQASIEPAGIVPADEAVKRANHLGQPVLTTFPDCAASRGYRALAQVIAAWPVMRENNRDLDGFLRRLALAGGAVESTVHS